MTPIYTDSQVKTFANLIAREVDNCEVNDSFTVLFGGTEAIVYYSADVEEFEDGGWRPYNEKVEVQDFICSDDFTDEQIYDLQDKLNFLLN